MVTEIRIYVEGGGDEKATWSKLREGMDSFLSELRDIARRKRIRWHIVPCGSRDEAYKDFCTAVKQQPDRFNVLLVDAETSPVVETHQQFYEKLPWTHLKDRDTWECPKDTGNTHCFLMVECMEAWLVADETNLKSFYGSCLNAGALRGNPNVEEISKTDLYQKLAAATAKCKSPYHKTRHAFDILRNTNAREVWKRAPHCKRLFDVLAAQMGERLP